MEELKRDPLGLTVRVDCNVHAFLRGIFTKRKQADCGVCSRMYAFFFVETLYFVTNIYLFLHSPTDTIKKKRIENDILFVKKPRGKGK